jgi:medium-chain acyl-[acyl-carrier-protein] hydrolase
VTGLVRGGWVACRAPNPAARVRLLCFPHAGGGSLAFFHWAAELGADVEVCAVQLPGREGRLREPAIDDLVQLRERLADALLPALGEAPFAFYGHSFGALLAFELTRELRRRAAPLPRLLIAAGRAAPSRGRSIDPISALADDDAFLDALMRRYGGIPAALRGERELMAILLPTLRADLKIAEGYAYSPEPPLPVAIRAFGGLSDPAVDERALQDWSRETTAGFAVRWFRGGHFFVQEERGELLREIRTLVEEL